MRPLKPFPSGAAERLQRLLKKSHSLADYRRIQAILMRALHASTPAEIAAATGLTVNTVRILHSRFLREGENFLVNRPGRGGRRHAHLEPAQEAKFLERFSPQAQEGKVLELSSVKRAYEQLVGHPVAGSTVYRLLGRAGWRKVVPRPRHPKKQAEADAVFKKKSPR